MSIRAGRRQRRPAGSDGRPEASGRQCLPHVQPVRRQRRRRSRRASCGSWPTRRCCGRGPIRECVAWRPGCGSACRRRPRQADPPAWRPITGDGLSGRCRASGQSCPFLDGAGPAKRVTAGPAGWRGICVAPAVAAGRPTSPTEDRSCGRWCWN
ncbi:Hypothetical protein I596_317 [Dokdonella koreensis DS-123]|uniref:Uncharacterized protein n=1 Tax=Dokdonella koreensis DS-123 TaxID=1300342 RepID=A0A167GAW7_9GAMM|nr:Hypothetical protein I596_317 [Dokdonella koreensis DS-123]